jgi:hypothetical protein
MINDAITKLQEMTKMVITCMREAGIEMDKDRQCKFVVYCNPQEVQLVEKYLTAAPVNIYTLATLLLTTRKAVEEALAMSRATDQKSGLESSSSLTELLKQTYENQDVVTKTNLENDSWGAKA